MGEGVSYSQAEVLVQEQGWQSSDLRAWGDNPERTLRKAVSGSKA